MFIQTLTAGNVQVTGANGDWKQEILREKYLLNLCLKLALNCILQILWSTNFVKQKSNWKNLKLGGAQCVFSLDDVSGVFQHEHWKRAVRKNFTVKIPYGYFFLYGKVSTRRNNRTEKFSTAKFPHGEISLRRNFLAAKFPHDEISLRRKFPKAEIPMAKFSRVKFPTANFLVTIKRTLCSDLGLIGYHI